MVRQQSLRSVLASKVFFRGLALPIGVAEKQLADVAERIINVRQSRNMPLIECAVYGG